MPYTSPQVTELTGVSYRQLDYWARIGLLKVNATGSGYVRQWSEDDLIRVRFIGQLYRLGASAKTVKQALRLLNERIVWGIDESEYPYLVVSEDGMTVRSDSDQIESGYLVSTKSLAAHGTKNI